MKNVNCCIIKLLAYIDIYWKKCNRQYKYNYILIPNMKVVHMYLTIHANILSFLLQESSIKYSQENLNMYLLYSLIFNKYKTKWNKIWDEDFYKYENQP